MTTLFHSDSDDILIHVTTTLDGQGLKLTHLATVPRFGGQISDHQNFERVLTVKPNGIAALETSTRNPIVSILMGLKGDKEAVSKLAALCEVHGVEYSDDIWP